MITKIELTKENKNLFEELTKDSGVNLNNALVNVFIRNSLIRELDKSKKMEIKK